MIHSLNKYLIIIFPIFLVIGPALSDIAVSVLSISYVYICFREKYYDDFQIWIVKLLIIFWLYCVCRSILSEDPLLSLESSLFYGRFIFFALALKYYLIKYIDLSKHFGIMIWVTILFVTFDALYQFLFGYNILNYKADEYRISGIFGDEYVLGAFLSRLLPFCFYFLAIQKNLRGLIFLLAMLFIILVDVLIYLAGERTAFIYLILSTVIIVLLTQRYRLIRSVAFIISLSLIFFTTFSLPNVKKRMVDYTLEQIGVSEKSEKIYFFSIKHQQHFESAFLMFKENKIFGQGPKLFRKLCEYPEYDTGGCSTHPHNIYIQLLAETGIIGFIFIFILFILILCMLFINFFYLIFKFKNQKKYFVLNDSTVCLLACFFVSLWPFVPTGSFFTNWTNAIMYLPLGFYLFERRNLLNKDNKY